MEHFIPLSVPNFNGNERKYVDDAIDQTWVSTGGAYITSLEERLAQFLGVEKVAACQSGTSAIHMALRMCGVIPGDLVIAPALTFIAAVNPIRYQFADPIFMDCDDSLCMDPIKLREFCETECELRNGILYHKETDRAVKALVVVHVFGNMADMEAIMSIANEYHLKVVEDATEALGTRYTESIYKGRYAGTIGDYGAYSFNGNKIITTGGGGAVTAKNPEDVDYIKYLSTQAKDDPHYYIHDDIGYNYRMTNLQAALGVAQLEQLSDFIGIKQENYNLYSKLLSNYNNGHLLGFRDGTESNKWFYSLVIDRSVVSDSIRSIIEKLEKCNIQTRAIWGLINDQKPYRDCIAYKIDKARFYSECVLNIPCSTNLQNDEIEYVVDKICEFVK